MKSGNVLFFFPTVPCLYKWQCTCTAVIPCALDRRLGVSPGRIASASDFSPWCGNAGAHNGCDSKTNASSLLLITLAETPRCSETTDGADLGRVVKKEKKKKAPTNLELPFLFFLIMFCYLYNSLPVLPFPILYPPPLAF